MAVVVAGLARDTSPLAGVRATKLRPPCRRARRRGLSTILDVIAPGCGTILILCCLGLLVITGANSGEEARPVSGSTLSGQHVVQAGFQVGAGSQGWRKRGGSSISVLGRRDLGGNSSNLDGEEGAIDLADGAGVGRRLKALREGATRPSTAPGGDAARLRSGRRGGTKSHSSSDCSVDCSGLSCRGKKAKCRVGYYRKSTAASNSGVKQCKMCKANFWCPGLDSPPQPCGTGMWTAGVVGASSPNQCVCVPGTVRSGSSCVTCPAGSYCVGGTTTLSATCPSGKTSSAGSSQLSDCGCLAGYNCVNSACATCSACAVGTYQASAGANVLSCTSCPSMSTTSGMGATSIALCTCFSGTYKGNSLCITCPAGSFCSSEQLVLCPANSTSPASRY